MSDLASVRSAESNSQKSFALAILLTIGGAILVFALSRTLFIGEDFVGSIYENGVPRALAGFVFLAFPYIHQRLAGNQRNAAVSLKDYLLPVFILLTCGFLIAFGMAGVSLFVIWLVGMITGVFVTQVISVLSLFLLVVTFYYLGLWIGSRSLRRPYLQAIAIVLGHTVLELLVSVLLNIDSSLRSPLRLGGFLILSLLAVLIGVSLGTRRRLLSYVAFLLKPLPEKKRHKVVENFYSDVKQQVDDEG